MRAHTIGNRALSAVVLVVTLAAGLRAVGPTKDDFCQARYDHLKENNVTDCGSTCPPLVKSKPVMGTVADIPHEGVLAFSDLVGVLKLTPLTSYSPKMVMDGQNVVKMGGLYFSPDGQWILGLSVDELWLVKRDGSSVFKTGIKAERFSWYYASPKEDPARKVYEIAYTTTDKRSAWAQTIDLSGATPVLRGNRKIAEGLWENDGDFAVGGDIILWDVRDGSAGTSTNVPWSRGTTSRCSPTLNYTIPNGGLGVAGQADLYKMWGCFNCAVSLNLSATMFTMNIGRLYIDCLPETHKGPVIGKVKHSTDSIVSVGDWHLDPEAGAVAVIWVPDSINGIVARGYDFDQEFFGWRFVNDDNYIVGFMGKNVDNNLWGIYLIHWPTNTWIPLTPYNVKGSGVVWFDGVASAVAPRGPSGSGPARAATRRQSLGAWHTLLGRRMAVEPGAAPSVEARGGAVRIGSVRTEVSE